MLNLKKILFCCLILLTWPIILNAQEPTILINEIAWMGTLDSSTDEWLELYNSTQNDINLTGWKIESIDGSPKINLEGTISAGGYFLLERTDDDSVSNVTADQIYTGSLSNSGEWLKLTDNDSKLIDEIKITDGWLGGDNGTKQTLERTNQNSWQTSAKPGGTPKFENSTTDSSEEPVAAEETPPEDNPSPESTPKDNQAKAKKGDIIITEIFPNPIGVDNKLEFIEIKNVSVKDIDLTNWKIKNAAKQIFIISSLKMTPESIVTFNRKKTKLAINNSKDKIKLYSKSNLIISQIEYKKKAPENESYQINNDGKYVWAEISPGEDMVVKDITLPVAIIDGPQKAQVGEIISFDASDSFDPKNRELNFFWDFGDGRKDNGVFVRQIYLEPGSYDVLLNVAVNQNASTTKKLKIKITGETKKKKKISNTTPASTLGGPATTAPIITPLIEIPFIFISEFLPNPKGSDTETEFIEIFSNHDKPVNLNGWKLDDAEGGSKPYIIHDTIIKPGQYLAFFRATTKIALNNSNEAVRLLTPSDVIVDYTYYEESKEDVSFVLDEQFSWHQSQTPTPGEINVLDELTKEPEKDDKEDKTKKTEPKILGIATKEIIEENEPKNKTKYIVSGVSVILILGIGGLLKIKNK